MALVEVLDVRVVAAEPGRVRGFALDAPRPGATAEVYRLDLEGWVIGAAVPAVAIEVEGADGVLRRVPVGHPRPDIAGRYPDVGGAEQSGFRVWLGLVGLPAEFAVEVWAVLKDGGRVLLATVVGRHRALRSGFEPRLQPLMLTTLGRAGSTWAMRLLAEHPSIVAHPVYPYELRTGRYWLHMAHVLAQPANPYQSAHPDHFQTNKAWLGHDPFYPEPAITTPGLDGWLGRGHVEEVAAFCQRAIDACYGLIAADAGKPDARFFAEKHRADHLPWLAWELYPRAREVFLVRDFRDVVSSMRAMNDKTGRTLFNRDGPPGDEALVDFVRDGPVRLLAESWPRRRDRAHLLRYEDLIERPKETLAALLTYLGVDADAAVVDGMIARASAESPELAGHRTSREPRASIGRWRRDLPPSVQAACRDALGEALAQFGYAP